MNRRLNPHNPSDNSNPSYFRSVPTYVITMHQRYRKADRRLAVATTLCVASRAKNDEPIIISEAHRQNGKERTNH